MTLFILYLYFFNVDKILPQGKLDGVAVEKSGFHDNWDDAEGYYGMWLTLILSIYLCCCASP